MGRTKFTRKKATKKQNIAILIICCGEKTEYNYFKEIKRTTRFKPLTIKITPMNISPSQMVNEAITSLKDQYDQIWCVFDKDDFDDVEKAYLLAEKHGKINLAYSNPCFELWFCLHFDNSTGEMNYTTCKRKIERNLGRSYNKADTSLYSSLESKKKAAIVNAKKLAVFHESEQKQVHMRNPYTSVYLLIEEIERIMNQ